jgi:hypothetical protein
VIEEARQRGWSTIAAAVAAAIVATLAPPPLARADGDPASDMLLTQAVFVPVAAPPSPSATAALDQAVDAVYEHGDRLKVAVIGTPSDLGAVPSLFGHPSDYAQFLGTELQYYYAGPLLVVMPSGFGIYDEARSTTAEQAVLSAVPLDAGTPDDLVMSAVAAIDRSLAAGTLASPDLTAPLVTTYPATARLGKTANLRFDLYDDSGRTAAVIRVYANTTLLTTLTAPMTFSVATRSVVVQWPVPRVLSSRRLRFCVTAVDPSGNRSQPTCADFLRIT